ncbi:hypothetical protein GCM10009593_14580 [Microlunatus antarcticus]
MAVENTASPKVSPTAPNAEPVNVAPSSRTRSAGTGAGRLDELRAAPGGGLEAEGLGVEGVGPWVEVINRPFLPHGTGLKGWCHVKIPARRPRARLVRSRSRAAPGPSPRTSGTPAQVAAYAAVRTVRGCRVAERRRDREGPDGGAEVTVGTPPSARNIA